MATVKAISSKASIGRAVKYITNPAKTTETLISGYNCQPETALQEMQCTKLAWGKTGGRTYKHFTQNFHKDDKITPEEVHAIGKELVEKCEQFEGFEVLLATHVDKDHLHNHFILNSVNFEDGHKFQMSAKQLQEIKDLSDQLCSQRNLHIVEKGKTFEGAEREELTAYNKDTYQILKQAEKKEAKSFVMDIAKAVMECRELATSRQQFIDMMDERGIRTDWQDNHRYITFTDIARELEGETKCKVRNKKLESEFHIPLGKEDLEHSFEINAQAKATAKALDPAKLIEAYRDMKNKEKDVLQREKYIVRERPINQDLIDRPQKLRESMENLAVAYRVRKECEEKIRTEYPPKPTKPKGILVTKKKQDQYQLDLNAWNTMVEPLVLLARQNHTIVETEFEELKKHLKPYEMQVGYDGRGRYDDSKSMINPYFMTDRDVSQLESCVEQLIAKPHDGYQAIADLEQRLSHRLNELNGARNDLKASQSRFIDIAKHFSSEAVDKAIEVVDAEFSHAPSPSVEQTQQKAREGTWADVSVKIAQERAKEQRNHQETQPKKQKQKGHEWSK